MQKLFITFTIAISCTFVGCKSSNPPKISKTTPSQKLPESVSLGSSTGEEIKKELGEPSTTTTLTVDGVKIENLEFKNLGTVQVQDNIAQAFMRPPVDHEKVLQYWLQKWAKEETKTSPVVANIQTHIDNDEELNCPKEKTSVIYDKSTGIVKRVITYAEK